MRGSTLVLALGLLVLATVAHALADTSVHAGPQRTLDVPLANAYDQTYSWTTTVPVKALGARILPHLAASGAPSALTDAQAQMPALDATLLVDGAQVWTARMDGDAATWSATIEIGSCSPSSACAHPPTVAGWRDVEVTMLVRVHNDAAQPGQGSYRVVLGPLAVEEDRGPWL